MWHVVLRSEFSAAHQLRGNFGPCENLHGHNWKVVVSISGNALDSQGLLIDFRQIQTHLTSILALWDHTVLNELAEFQDKNPSCENLAYVLFQSLKARLSGDPSIHLAKVEIFETDACSVVYEES